MQYFPIFVNLRDETIVVSGAGETAVAKLRLLLKTEARIIVFGTDPVQQIVDWASADALTLVRREIRDGDGDGARLLYAANAHSVKDTQAAAIGQKIGALINVVDNLADSEFITPAIVDRDPVTVAIGTEGAAPVLARRIKAQIEEQLALETGHLARIGKSFRAMADALPEGRPRRAFWSTYYERVGPKAWADGGEAKVRQALEDLFHEHLERASAARREPDHKLGYVQLIGAGPGDPDLLTLKARRALHEADVIIHDRLVSREVLELARREAIHVEVGKTPGGTSWVQEDINALMVEHARAGAHVARLKSGDATIYGRLDEEMDALDEAGIGFEIVPGITSALAAAARISVSVTRRQRNSEFRLLTGQDVKGFAEHDWRALSRPGAVAAIYMGVRAARFLQGRLIMHDADPDTPVTVIEHVSRDNERVVSTTLQEMEQALRESGVSGPAIIFLGLTPRDVPVSAVQVITSGEMLVSDAALVQAGAR